MRIDRLDLVAFGPFTGMSLDLSAPGVHLVTGPNEAGKSTALHALDQLLYGIDVRSPYDFVHAKGALRLGALIRKSDGGTLEFVRSKARNTPLLGPDGSAVGQAELDAALGGVDRTTFRSVFALTSAELRRGGEELVHGGGDFRQALTASRSGLRLSETLRAIDERMAELYKQQGRRPVINMRIAELRRALERQRAALLRPEEYTRREREVAEAEEALARLAGELKEARREESRLERLSQALPALDRRRILLSRIEEVRGEGVLAPQEAADRLPGLLEELGNARRTLDDARRRLASTTDEMSRLVVDEDLLAVEGTIESLFQDHRDARSAARRLAKSAGDAAEARRTAEALLRQVHPDARFEDAARYDVPRSVRKRAQELHDRHTELETALARDRRAAGRLRRKLEEAEKELSGLPAAEETGPLRAVLAAIPDDLLSRMVADDEDERRLRGAVEQGLRDLKLGARPEAEAGGVTVPSEAEIGAHAEALDELKRDRRDLARRTKELARRLDADRLELAGLLNVDPPPTGDDLAAARSDRDALWREIRDGRRERVEEFTPAVARADHLADRLRQEADRVAKRYRLELQIGEGERELAECAGEESELDRRAEKLTGEWARLWEDFAGPRPASPKAAPAVLRAAERLREDADRLAAVRAGLASRREQASQHIARLREVLRVTGEASSLGADNALAELPELRELAETSLSRQERAAREHAALADRVTTARDELAEAEAQVAQGEHELDVWRADWDGLLARAGLAAGLETAEAVTRLESLEQVSAAVRSAARSDREMEQDTAVVERFHASLERVARECGRRLPDAEAERYGFVADLHREAQENRSAADRRAHLQAGHATLEADVDHHLRTTADLDAELAALVGKAGVADAEALGEAVRRRRRHTELAATLAEVTATLPVKEDALRALEREASDTDPGHLHADLEDLADRIGDLDRERAEHSALLGERRSLLAQLDGSAEAAQAAEDAETAAAALVEESEEYLRLRVAREIVTSCMEKYRQEQQDPILTRASALFRRLTLGGYAGLELDEDRDSPVVLARRGDRPLQVEQLSEGTRDQLYLALRLASLERYAEEGHTLPFVVDDIFMTFDDQRTRATLRVLEEMADRFQMIVFTHHDHLAELARAELPEGRLHLHPLPRFRPFV
ncbi:AAA family ATPase [Streptosporangium sp. NPDC048047]|uniref:ATP-binding protein n=1 Tax=Streptosporangium sp. NPDC048047 TaxID=3155748 RepID=UPI0034124869